MSRNQAGARYDFHIDPSNERSTYAWQVRFTQAADSVLEIGCSTGFLSRHLVARGCQVVGVELDAAAAEQARSVCRRVVVGDVEAPDVQARVHGPFDTVLLGDVLEHLRAPAALLSHVRRAWLAPGGWVVLSVPNSGHWLFRREVLRGRFPYRRYGLFDHSHLRFFTRASLYRLVAETGYRVEDAAVTVNPNCFEDITFALLGPLYRRPACRYWLLRLEHLLARIWPALFAYQFVLRIRPEPGP